MHRDHMISQISDKDKIWDMLIIGGGATGVGVAIDAASRGHSTLLVEQSDFGKGTSSRSTKLVHGGVRYLKQGNVALVLDALKERGILHRNAPHLVHNLPFVVPNYDWWEGPFYGIGLKLYDMLAGKEGFGASKILSFEETLERIPTIETDGLKGGVVYYDGQFDDARLVINMVRTAAGQGATIINYMQVTGFLNEENCISGAYITDMENGSRHVVRANVVVNACGVYSDALRKLDDKSAEDLISPSQGVHIILDKSFLPRESAIMIPETDDGRVLFAIPWHDRVVVGTTDTEVDNVSLEPIPLKSEVEFLLTHAARYLTKDPTEKDILSMYAGLRPLVRDDSAGNTASLSRDHTIHISRAGLVTITGGKWTTYRKMAEETVEQAVVLAQLPAKPCVTANLAIHGHHNNPKIFGHLQNYGSDAPEIEEIFAQQKSFSELIDKNLPIRVGEIVWAVRQEMARTVEDFLARRTRALLLDARASIRAAQTVAEYMANELGHKRNWVKDQVLQYTTLAKKYFPPEN